MDLKSFGTFEKRARRRMTSSVRGSSHSTAELTGYTSSLLDLTNGDSPYRYKRIEGAYGQFMSYGRAANEPLHQIKKKQRDVI